MSRAILALLLVIVAVAKAGVVVERDAPAQGRAAATVTLLTTSYYSGTTTTTVLTGKVCGSLAADATAFCRRKRQAWLDIPVLMAEDPDIDAFLKQSFQASPVQPVEPTAVQGRSFGKSQALESSIDEQPEYIREADPFSTSYISSLSAIFSTKSSIKSSISSAASSAISGILTPAVTVTSTAYAYSATSTVNLVTGTKSYTISGCIPPNLAYTAC